jgi:hypothetical protein
MDLKIEAYTDKSIVVFGNTKDYKDQLKEYGGKWNSNLNKNGEKFGGWIYPISKKTELENWIQGLKSGIKSTPPSTITKISTPAPTNFFLTEQRLARIEDKLDKIISLLQVNTKDLVKSDDEEEEEVPMKRLLRK